jgi:hypothetical protein
VSTTVRVNDGPEVPLSQFTKGARKSSKAPQKLPQSVIDDLVEQRANAKAHADAFGEAVKAQAEKYGAKPSALKKYVCALESDSVDKVQAEVDSLEVLLS